MKIWEKINGNRGGIFHRRRNPAQRLAVPLSIFGFLIVINGYFWCDYFFRENKISAIVQETGTLISGAAEDQNISLSEAQKKSDELEKENSALTAELASTTSALADTDIQLLKYDTEIAELASSTETEMEKSHSPFTNVTPVKNILSL